LKTTELFSTYVQFRYYEDILEIYDKYTEDIVAPATRSYTKCRTRDAFVLIRSRAALSRAQHHTRNTRALAFVVWEEINSQITVH